MSGDQEDKPKTEVIQSVTVDLPRGALLGCGIIQCRFKISSLFGKRVMWTRRAIVNEDFINTYLAANPNEHNNNQIADQEFKTVRIDLGAVLSGFPAAKKGFAEKEIEACLFFQPAADPNAEFIKLKLPEMKFGKNDDDDQSSKKKKKNSNNNKDADFETNNTKSEDKTKMDSPKSKSDAFLRTLTSSFSCSALPWAFKGGVQKSSNNNNNSQSSSGVLTFRTKVIEIEEDAADTSAFSTRCTCRVDFKSTFAKSFSAFQQAPTTPSLFNVANPLHVTVKFGLDKIEIFPFQPKSLQDLEIYSSKSTISTSFPFTWRMNEDVPQADHTPEACTMTVEVRQNQTDEKFFRYYEYEAISHTQQMAASWPVRNSIQPLPLPRPSAQIAVAEHKTENEEVTSDLSKFFPETCEVSLQLTEETQQEQVMAKAKTMIQKIDDVKAKIRSALNAKLASESAVHHDDDGDGKCDEQAGPFIALNQLRDRVSSFIQKTSDAKEANNNNNNSNPSAPNELVAQAKEILDPSQIAGQLKSVEQCLRAFSASINNPFVDPGQAFQVAMEEILPADAAAKVTQTLSAAFSGLKTFQGDLVSKAGKAADAVADLLAPVASAALGALGNVLGELGSAVAGVAADVIAAVPFIGMFVAPLISIGKKLYKQYNEKKLADEECEKLLARLSEHFEWFKRYQDFTKLLEKRGAQVRKLLARAQLTIADCFDAVQEDKKAGAVMKFVTATGRQQKFSALRADLDGTFALIEKEIQFGFMFETLGEVKDISAKIDLQMKEEAKRAAEMQAQMKELASLMPGQLKRRAKELSPDATFVLVEQTKASLRRCVRSVHPEMITEVPNEMGRSIQFPLDKKYIPVLARQHVNPNSDDSVNDNNNNNNNNVNDNDEGSEDNNNNDSNLSDKNKNKNANTSNNNNNNNNKKDSKNNKVEESPKLRPRPPNATTLSPSQKQQQYRDASFIETSASAAGGSGYGYGGGILSQDDDDAMLVGGRVVARKSEALFRASVAGAHSAARAAGRNVIEEGGQMNNPNNNKYGPSANYKDTLLAGSNNNNKLKRKGQQQQSNKAGFGGGELQDLNTIQFADRISRLPPQSHVIVLDGPSSIGKTSFAQKVCLEQLMPSHIAIYVSLARFVNSSNNPLNAAGDGDKSRFWKLLRQCVTVSAMSDFMVHIIEEQRIPLLWVVDDIELVQTNKDAIEFLQEFVCPVGRFEHAADGEDGVVRPEDFILAVMRDPHRTAPGVDFFSESVPADRWGVRAWEPENVRLLPHRFFVTACVPDGKRLEDQINNCLKKSPAFQTSPFFAQLLCELVLRGGATADRIKKGKFEANTTQLLELVVKESWNRDSTVNKIKERYNSVVHSESTFDLMLNGAGYHSLKYMRRQVPLEFTVNVAPDNWAWLLTQADLTQFAGYQQRVFLDLSYVEYFAAQYILRHMETSIDTIPWDNDQRVVWMHVATLLACDVDRMTERDKLLEAIGRNVAREYNSLAAQDRYLGWKYDVSRWGKWRRDLAMSLLADLAVILDEGYRKFPRIGKPNPKNGSNNNNNNNNSSKTNNNNNNNSNDDSENLLKSETFEAVLRAMDAYEQDEIPISFNLSKLHQIGNWIGKKIPTVGGPVGAFIQKSQETARKAKQGASRAFNVTNRPWMLWLLEPCGRTGCKSGVEWIAEHVNIDDKLYNEALYAAFESKPSFSPILLHQGARVELKKACDMGAHNAVRTLVQINKVSSTSSNVAASSVLSKYGAENNTNANNNNNKNNKGNNNSNNNNNNGNDENEKRLQTLVSTLKLPREQFMSSLRECLQSSADKKQAEVAFELLDGATFSRGGLCVPAAMRCVRDGPPAISQKLTYLDLRDCNLGNEGAIQILEATLPFVEVLSLARNNIGPAGFEFFARVARLTLPKLQYVNLSHNTGYLCGILMILPTLLEMTSLIDFNITKNGVQENFRDRYSGANEQLLQHLSAEGKLSKLVISDIMRCALDCFGVDAASFLKDDAAGYGPEGIRRLLWILDPTSRTKPLQRVSFAGSKMGVGGMVYLFDADQYQYGELSRKIITSSTTTSNTINNNNNGAASPTSLFFPQNDSSSFGSGSLSLSSATDMISIPHHPSLIVPTVRRKEAFSKLVELDLSGCNLDGYAITKLNEAVVNCEPKWRSLALANNPIGSKERGAGGVAALADFLTFLKDTPLTILNLRDCELDIDSLSHLRRSLRILHKLKSIDLSRNDLNSPVVFAIIGDIKNIEIVNLANINLELLTLTEVYPHLSKMKNVSNLDLSFNSIDDASLRIIKKKLPNENALIMFQ